MLYPTELRASWMTIGRARTFSRFIRMAQPRARCSLRPAWSSARNTKVRTCTSAATLIARCRSNTTDAYIAWGEFMDTDDLFVTVRTTGGLLRSAFSGLLPSVLTYEPPFDTFAFCRSMHRQFVAIPLDFHPRTADRHAPRHDRPRIVQHPTLFTIRRPTNDDTAPYDGDTEPYISPSAYLQPTISSNTNIITISAPDSNTECPREYQRGPRACDHPMTDPLRIRRVGSNNGYYLNS